MKQAWIIIIAVIAAVACFAGGVAAKETAIANVSTSGSSVSWQPLAVYPGLVLTVSRPDGEVIEQTFGAGETPSLAVSGGLPDGQYTWELRVSAADASAYRLDEAAGAVEATTTPYETLSQSGSFTVSQGTVVDSAGSEALPTKDVLHYDDVIITGSLAVGFDAVNGESFGFDTIILKEHNLRIYFNDTSYTASYPANDWRITINDSTNGGANYFSIDDVDDGASIFKIEAGAPSNSLYVEDYGRIGLGTSTPVVELHIKDSDTPTTRLEQDSSGGWTAQTWDVAGNESNFFIRDATNGSKLPFRIQPSTPSSTLCLKSDGNVGIGTWSPNYPLELETTGEAATFVLNRTDGAMAYINAGGTNVNMGSASDNAVNFMVNGSAEMTIDTVGNVGIGTSTPAYPLELKTTGEAATFVLDRTDGAMAYVTAGGTYVNMGAASTNHLRLMADGTWQTQINTDGSLTMASGATCSAGGVWANSSSRELKENIENISADEALETLSGLEPVKYNYKVDKTDAHLGFIAEDVPDLVASKGRKAMSPMDIAAVLTKVVQEQQTRMQEQQTLVRQQQQVIADLQSRLEALEQARD
jgi:Chaperone of endosialidase